MNLGLLCYFKYVNFFLGSLQESLRLVGVSASLPLLSVVLPVGISFYTFEAINYMVDIYRRGCRPKDSRSFPAVHHVLSAPGGRADRPGPRTSCRRSDGPSGWDWSRVQVGVQSFCSACSRNWSSPTAWRLFVDPVFDHPAAVRRHGALDRHLRLRPAGLLRFLRLHRHGPRLRPPARLQAGDQLRHAYTAANVAEFWRRWHISLSTWLRDYLFIPLGGSRGTAWQDRPQFAHHDDAWRPVAWGELDVRPLGPRPWTAACRPSRLPCRLRSLALR